MEFLDEEARPRFLLQTRGSSSASAAESESTKLNKIQFLCFSAISIALLFFAFFFLSDSETLQFFLVWASLSLLVGPFAPVSATGGDISVGKGDPLPPLDPDSTTAPEEPRKRNSGRRSKPRRSDDPIPSSLFTTAESGKPALDGMRNSNSASNGDAKSVAHEEKEWTEEDFELLKKQIAKYPVGTTRRWESIAEIFRGHHGLDSVIDMAKSMADRRPNGGDSFAQFLKHRKPLSKQLEGVNGESNLPSAVLNENGHLKESGNWSSGEDIALLNALKVFPKDASMRWEKIAAAVPGKSKACCMKRVTELKRGFRSSKASEAM